MKQKTASVYIVVAGILWGLIALFVRKLNANGFESMDIVLLRSMGAMLLMFFGLLLMMYFRNEVLPVPAFPVTKILSFVSLMKRHASSKDSLISNVCIGLKLALIEEFIGQIFW